MTAEPPILFLHEGRTVLPGYDPKTRLYSGIPIEKLLTAPLWEVRTFHEERLAWMPPTPPLKLPPPEPELRDAMAFLPLLEARRLARAPLWHTLTVLGAIGTAVVHLLRVLAP